LKLKNVLNFIIFYRYNKLSKEVRDIAKKIKDLDNESLFRAEQSAALLEKLYMMGLIPTKWDLSLCEKITASSFCRRRLPVIMVRSRMCETIKMATQLIEQSHVRVGPEVIKDPAFFVTRYNFSFINTF
jgi:U3 small nucleolar ribonucleoprotein protein IMP3